MGVLGQSVKAPTGKRPRLFAGLFAARLLAAVFVIFPGVVMLRQLVRCMRGANRADGFTWRFVGQLSQCVIR